MTFYVLDFICYLGGNERKMWKVFLEMNLKLVGMRRKPWGRYMQMVAYPARIFRR